MEKRERGHIQGLPINWVPPIISGTGKVTAFKFCTHIHRVIFFRNVYIAAYSQGVSNIFRAPAIGLYEAHCAVIFASTCFLGNRRTGVFALAICACICYRAGKNVGLPMSMFNDRQFSLQAGRRLDRSPRLAQISLTWQQGLGPQHFTWFH